MMMMMNEHHHHSPTVQIPISQWDHVSTDLPSPFSDYPSLHRYLPSVADDANSDDSDSLSDVFSCDHFRMFEFKVRRCSRGRSHDWTECPFAHPGEKARRRDPRRHHYSGTACPDFRKGSCRRGDACEFAHGVFECWLHPARYRTQPCKDGLSCRRRVCFFAHTAAQLRLLSTPSSGDHSPPESPRMFSSPRLLSGAVRALQISSSSPPAASAAWGFGGRTAAAWEEAPMERVESGRNLRAIMYARLSTENLLGRGGGDLDSSDTSAAPDVGWISELIN